MTNPPIFVGFGNPYYARAMVTLIPATLTILSSEQYMPNLTSGMFNKGQLLQVFGGCMAKFGFGVQSDIAGYIWLGHFHRANRRCDNQPSQETVIVFDGCARAIPSLLM